MLCRWMLLISALGRTIRGEAGSRRVAGWGDQHFEQRDESQAFNCAECDRIAGAAGSSPLLRQRQGGHYYQPDHGSAQRWPGCGYDFGGDFDDPHLAVSGLTVSATVAAGGTAAVTVAFSPTSSVPYTASIKRNVECRGRFQVFLVSGRGASLSVFPSWRASKSLVVSYNIYRSTVSGGPYTKQTPSLVPGTTWRDTSVAAGPAVLLLGDGGRLVQGKESGYSNEASDLVPRRKQSGNAAAA